MNRACLSVLGLFVGLCITLSGCTPAIKTDAQGFPTLDHEWSDAEAVVAGQNVAKIGNSEPAKLPRFSNPESGPLFQRLVADTHLERMRDKQVDIRKRFPAAAERFQAAQGVIGGYVQGLVKGEKLSREVIEIMGSMLRNALMMSEAADEFMPTLDKNDPSYPTRVHGQEQMKSGMAQIVGGVLTTLTEADNYSVEERKIMLGYARDTIPALFKHLSAEGQATVRAQLESLKTNEAARELGPGLDELIAAVK